MKQRISILAAVFVFSATGYATTCEPSTVDKMSDAYIRETYNSANLIGTFKIVEVGPKRNEELIGLWSMQMKFAPVKILKGKSDPIHVHNFSGFGPDPHFQVGHEYLAAFINEPNKNTSTNDPCLGMLLVEAKSAKFYLKKFSALKAGKK